MIPDTVRAPDVAFVQAERIPPSSVKGFFQGAPDLAVEVISPSDRPSEVAAKVQDWLRAGCSMVWVVDAEKRAVTVHCGGEVVVMTSAETLTGGEILPDFSMPVANILP
jgi:Uma2 family endonuclease